MTDTNGRAAELVKRAEDRVGRIGAKLARTTNPTFGAILAGMFGEAVASLARTRAALAV